MQFDDIVEAVIIREKNSQRSKGYGFVSNTSLMRWSSGNAMIGINLGKRITVIFFPVASLS